MKNDIKYVMLAIGDLLELLEKVNAMDKREKTAQHPSQAMLEQYQELKNDYLSQMAELLKEFDVKIELPRKVA